MLLCRSGTVTIPRKAVEVGGDLRITARQALYRAIPTGNISCPELFAIHVEAAAVAAAAWDAAAYLPIVSAACSMLRDTRHPPLPTIEDLVLRAGLPPAAAVAAATAGAEPPGGLVAKAAALAAQAKATAAAAADMSSGTTPSLLNRCPKCRSTAGIAVISKAIRSGDEGMVDHCTCASCGTTWRA